MNEPITARGTYSLDVTSFRRVDMTLEAVNLPTLAGSFPPVVLEGFQQTMTLYGADLTPQAQLVINDSLVVAGTDFTLLSSQELTFQLPAYLTYTKSRAITVRVRHSIDYLNRVEDVTLQNEI